MGNRAEQQTYQAEKIPLLLAPRVASYGCLLLIVVLSCARFTLRTTNFGVYGLDARETTKKTVSPGDFPSPNRSRDHDPGRSPARFEPGVDSIVPDQEQNEGRSLQTSMANETANLAPLPISPEKTCKWSKYKGYPYSIPGYKASSTPTRQKIVYLKVPKSGSTTISCLLKKFGTRRDMQILYPASGASFDGDLGDFNQAMTEQNISEPDMLASHMTYYETAVNSVLGVSEDMPPFRISSVRNPEDRILSSYFYARLIRAQGRNEAFVCSDISDDYTLWARDCKIVGQVKYMRPHEWNLYSPEDVFKHFEHIFVTERMVESILTLMPKLDFSLNDILMVSMKAKGRGDVANALSEKEALDLRRLVHDREQLDDIDSQFYELADQKLDHELQNLLPELRASIVDIEAMTQDLQEFCASSAKERPLFIPCTNRFISYHVDCDP